MAIDHNKTWMGYLTASVIDQCIADCMADCPGCNDNMYSPLLHRHNSFNLRAKVEHYFHQVIYRMNVSSLFDKFIVRFGFYTLDREEFVKSGRYFFNSATPTSIMFGDYVTPSLDTALYAKFPIKEQEECIPKSSEPANNNRKRKNSNQATGQNKKLKRNIKAHTSKNHITSQNGVFGDGSVDAES